MRRQTLTPRIFSQCSLRSRFGLLPTDSRWGYCVSIRERRTESPVVVSCGLGRTMSGVIAAMRRTLLSCTSLVRDGIVGLAVSALAVSTPARASDLQLVE